MNVAHNPTTAGVPWTHWLSPVPHAHAHYDPRHGYEHRAVEADKPKDSIRVERAVMPLQDYAWTMLNTSTAWSTTFNSSGQYAWHLIRFSLSGIPYANDLVVSLDGRDLHWKPRKDIGIDRWHYDIRVDASLEPGEHKLTFRLKSKEAEGQAQLCSVEILEFGDENE